jgi:N-acetylglucosaminyl-diphospho-decaprenol L-rhamnosyltransferase
VRFSAVIVNYASWPLTLRCIASLRETGYEDLEIVVVDNGGGEGPPELPPEVRLIRNPRNEGFARACNRGIAVSRGEVILLINPDARVLPGFFERAADLFASDPRLGIAGPRITGEDGRLQLSARREITPASGLVGRTSLLTRLLPKSRLVREEFPTSADPSRPAEVDWVSGACMLVRRRALEDVGPLDERFFMYFEDADLCRRARQRGWRVRYEPALEAAHHTGGSSHNRPRAVWLLHKSAFLYHRKHGPRGPLGLWDLLVLAGLAARALAKLVAGTVARGRG